MSLIKAIASAKLVAVESNPLDLAAGNQTHTKTFAQQFSDGTGSGQVQAVFSDNRSLDASTSEDLDLAGGLVDAQGKTFTFTAVKAIMIVAASTNGGNIEVGGAATNQFVGPLKDGSDIAVIPPGGVFFMADPGAAGWPVTAGTGDLLKINNTDSGGAASYDILILGEGSKA